jgi:hypothetical protein
VVQGNYPALLLLLTAKQTHQIEDLMDNQWSMMRTEAAPESVEPQPPGLYLGVEC